MLNYGGVLIDELVLSQGDVLEVCVNQEESESPRRAPRRHGPPADAGGPGDQFSEKEVKQWESPCF